MSMKTDTAPISPAPEHSVGFSWVWKACRAVVGFFWKAKSLPEPVGLREVPLSELAAKEMQRMLDDPRQPAHSGKEMPTADADALLKQRP